MNKNEQASRLFFSSAVDVTPSLQTASDQELMASAAQGQTRLHVSTLAPRPTLGLGRFQRRPAPHPEVSLWFRHTGGRAVASGPGFVIITLALPHRAALVAPERQALAPEQVLNRCVRGILATLRGLGVEATYPGLDLVTRNRQALGVLSFVESDGPTLVQGILATSTPFSEGALLLDRVDPEGVVPSNFIAPSEAVTLFDLAGGKIAERVHPSPLSEALALAYRDTFGIEIVKGVPPTGRDVPLDAVKQPQADSPGFLARNGVRTQGLLGPVEAWATHERGYIQELVLRGDFIAPATFPQKLARALQGCATDASAIQARINPFLDKDENYMLGLTPQTLMELVQRSVGAPP